MPLRLQKRPSAAAASVASSRRSAPRSSCPRTKRPASAVGSERPVACKLTTQKLVLDSSPGFVYKTPEKKCKRRAEEKSSEEWGEPVGGMDRPGSASLWTEVEKDVSCQCRSLAPSAYRYEWDDVKDEDKLEALREATEVASRLAPWVPECQLSTECSAGSSSALGQHDGSGEG